MQSAVLIGCGSEIGANFLIQNANARDQFRISHVVTNQIESKQGSRSIEAIYARLLMAEPSVIDKVKIEDDTSLVVNDHKVQFWFNDFQDANFSMPPGDIGILATSKNDIGSPSCARLMQDRFQISFGVAEAANVRACYPNLQGIMNEHLSLNETVSGGYYAVGSCQSNGWHVPLNVITGYFNDRAPGLWQLARVEVDIVHPDTPTGRLGTKSSDPRDQDARNNLRPSASQVKKSMKDLLPTATCEQSVSLRVLTMPPGYQICRFFFVATSSGSGETDISAANLSRYCRAFELDNSDLLRCVDLPLGSRCFSGSLTGFNLLVNEDYLKVAVNPLGDTGGRKIIEVIMQGYVHNVAGYVHGVRRLINNYVNNSRIYVS